MKRGLPLEQTNSGSFQPSLPSLFLACVCVCVCECFVFFGVVFFLSLMGLFMFSGGLQKPRLLFFFCFFVFFFFATIPRVDIEMWCWSKEGRPCV